MKIHVTNGKKRVILDTKGHQIGIQAPDSGEPFMIEAELMEGSPFRIVVDGGGKAGTVLPVGQARLVHSKTYLVNEFKRTTKGGTAIVKAHSRRMPVRIKRTGKSI